MPVLLLFWLAALAVVAAALAAIVWPLLRGGRAPTPANRLEASTDAAAAVYRDQKRQLDNELAAGAIDAPEHAQAQDELTARLARELQTSPGAPARKASPRARLGWVLGVGFAFPIAAAGLYALLGNPGAMRVATETAQAPTMSQAQVVAMVDQLAAHMQAQPDDAKGWRLLGRSYGSLGRYRDAADAFHEAAQRGPVDADLLVDWADALGMANGQSLAGEPTRLVERALALEPGNVKALLLAASAAEERHDNAAAIEAWRRLKVELPPGSPEVREIDALIARAGASDGRDGGTASSTIGADATGAGAAAEAGATSAAKSISGEVRIAPSLAARVAPGDTLFIYARAASTQATGTQATGGSRMPLAVIRETASPLPRTFALGDAQSMRPDVRLSTARTVIVEARISRSGNALPAAGDLYGASSPVAPGARDVTVVIGDVVK